MISEKVQSSAIVSHTYCFSRNFSNRKEKEKNCALWSSNNKNKKMRFFVNSLGQKIFHSTEFGSKNIQK